jgi:hypothetical protein
MFEVVLKRNILETKYSSADRCRAEISFAVSDDSCNL